MFRISKFGLGVKKSSWNLLSVWGLCLSIIKTNTGDVDNWCHGAGYYLSLFSLGVPALTVNPCYNEELRWDKTKTKTSSTAQYILTIRMAFFPDISIDPIQINKTWGIDKKFKVNIKHVAVLFKTLGLLNVPQFDFTGMVINRPEGGAISSLF